MLNLKKIYKVLLTIKNLILPRYISERLNVEQFGIENFIREMSISVKPTDKVLDAGAGNCKYKKYFEHANYESTDFKDIFDKSSYKIHSFICSLDDIPIEDNYYDVIINTQVLEHVEFPEKVIQEFYRILKPKGKLFLTCPQGYKIHGAPYNFFNFTKFGLKSIFERVGFKIHSIKPRGGCFWYLSNSISDIPNYILKQYLFEEFEQNYKFKPRVLYLLLIIPFYILLTPILTLIIPLIFFYLDKIDRKRDYTLGYKCYCSKG